MPGFPHPREHQRIGLALLRRQEHAGQSAFELGQPAQRVAVIPYALRIECGKYGGEHEGKSRRAGGNGAAILTRRPFTSTVRERRARPPREIMYAFSQAKDRR